MWITEREALVQAEWREEQIWQADQHRLTKSVQSTPEVLSEGIFGLAADLYKTIVQWVTSQWSQRYAKIDQSNPISWA